MMGIKRRSESLIETLFSSQRGNVIAISKSILFIKGDAPIQDTLPNSDTPSIITSFNSILTKLCTIYALIML